MNTRMRHFRRHSFKPQLNSLDRRIVPTVAVPGDFTAGTVTESFEGLTAGPNVSQSGGYFSPGIIGPFTFASGIQLTAPIPNPGLGSGVIVGDFSKGGAGFGLGPNGSISSAVDVPDGTAYLGWDNPAAPFEFLVPAGTTRVGGYVTGTTSVLIQVFDAGGMFLESHTIPALNRTLWTAQDASTFLGINNPAIRRVRFTGDFTVLDKFMHQVANAPPTGVSANGPYFINEGSSLSLMASATDTDPLTFTWDVNGDGTFGDATGQNPTLTWANLKTLGITDGPFFTNNVKVRVSDGVNPPVTSAKTSLTVNNVTPSNLTLNGPFNINEGQSINLKGNFTDPGDADPHVVEIDWDGDGTFDETISLGAGVLMFSKTHLYADDNPTGTKFDVNSINVRVADDDQPAVFATASTSIKVNNVAPTITSLTVNGGSAITIDEGTAVTLNGTFTDPALGVATETFSVTIDWGDGTPITKQTVSGGAFSIVHNYWDDNPTGTPFDVNTIKLKLSDDDTGSDTNSALTVRVNNIDPTVTGFEFGPEDNNIDDATRQGLRYVPMVFKVSFTDPSWFSNAALPPGVNPTSNKDSFVFQYDWDGNGTFEETVSGCVPMQSGPTLTVCATHAYDTAYKYQPRVRIIDDDTGVSNIYSLDGGLLTITNFNAKSIDGNLIFSGTQNNDIIRFNTVNPAAAYITLNSFKLFNPDVSGSTSFAVAPGKRVIIYGVGGNDNIQPIGGTSATVAIEVHAGDGNDFVMGGNASDFLFGDAGNDEVRGENGADLVSGGLGRDVVRGGNGNDIVIGGATSANAANLALYLTHWDTSSAALTMAERTALLASINDPIATGPLDNFEQDQLWGDAGRDLFVWRSNGPLLDLLRDFAGSDETLNVTGVFVAPPCQCL